MTAKGSDNLIKTIAKSILVFWAFSILYMLSHGYTVTESFGGWQVFALGVGYYYFIKVVNAILKFKEEMR